MSFQAYIDNIEAKTGLKTADLRQRAAAEGFVVGDAIAPGIKATRITDWLKAEFALGHGHAMAIYTTLKGRKP
jgi:hypothetical protein